jgi:uncharacterized protein (DUF3820 family)
MITITLTDQSLMPWGKYKGKTMANVPAPYLLLLHNGGELRDQAVKRYIEDNLDALISENRRINQAKNR